MALRGGGGHGAGTEEVVERSGVVTESRFPYVPGLFSFREAPALIQAYEALGERPDVLLLDGQGIAHPRGIGLASHVGLWLGIPTIGCAKSRLCGEHDEPGPARGDWRPLTNSVRHKICARHWHDICAMPSCVPGDCRDRREAKMARRRRRDLQPGDIEGLEYFDALAPLLARLKDIGTERDSAGNRQLFFDQYISLLLLYFFSPTITSLAPFSRRRP